MSVESYHCGLAISSLIFLPFAGILLGSTLISLFAANDDRKSPGTVFAASLMGISTGAFIWAVVLGLVPLVGVHLSFNGLMTSNGLPTTSILCFGALMFLISTISVYYYGRSLRVEQFLINTENPSKEALAFAEKNTNGAVVFGVLGLIGLIIGLYSITGAINLSLNAQTLNTSQILPALFSPVSLTAFVSFIGMSMGFAAATYILFAYGFTGSAGYDHLKASAGNAGIVGTTIMAFFGMVSYFCTPGAAITWEALALVSLIVVVLFLICHTFYYTAVYGETRIGATAFFLFIIAFVGLSFSDSFTRDAALSLERAPQPVAQADAHH